jgi:hypothetical protein
MSEKAPFEPATSIIARFGSAAEVGRILDLDKSTISRWTMPKEKRGTDGRIPHKYWEDLMTAAKQRKIKLTLRELASLKK